MILKHLFIVTKKKINELWHKMSNIATQLRHSNIADGALKRVRKNYGKKNRRHYRKRKTKIQSIFKDKEGTFIIEKLARDAIDRCKLPKAIELSKKLGYNRDDIIVREETSIAETFS